MHFDEGNRLLESDPDQAARCFTRAGQLDPDNHLIYLQRGKAHVNAGRIEKAERDADRALRRKKDFAEVGGREGGRAMQSISGSVLPRAHRAAEGDERACNTYRRHNAECY